MHTILLIVFFPVQAPLKDLSMQKPFSSWGDRVHDDIDKVLAGLSTWELNGIKRCHLNTSNCFKVG